MTIHIATPEEIGGSLDTDEIHVLHIEGPLRGMMLVNKKTDSTIAAALQAQEILVPPTFNPTPPEAPVVLTPVRLTGTPAVGQVLTAVPATYRSNPPATTDRIDWNIDGQADHTITGLTLTVAAEHVGKMVSLTQTIANSVGFIQSFSDPLGPITE